MRTITDHLKTVDGVSPTLAADIADAFPTWKALTEASTDDLRAVKGVGPVLARRIQAAAMAAGTSTTSTGSDEIDGTATSGSGTSTRTPAGDSTAGATDQVDKAGGPTGEATSSVGHGERDFADTVTRRRFGPFTLPGDLPWPVNMALDATETMVGLGLKVTTGVLSSVGRKLR